MDFDQFRAQFPVTREWVYLNNAGVAPVSRHVAEVVGAMMEEYVTVGYTHSKEWARRIEEIRAQAARIMNAQPEEIAFVRNTSHGLSLVARGLVWKPGDVVLVPEGEYPANVYPWMALARQGVQTRRIPMNKGGFPREEFQKAWSPNVRLVSVSHVEYLNGYVNDLDEIVALAHANGAKVCVDFIQSYGILPLDVQRTPFDFGAADAHKWMLGPEGIGIFYCRAQHIASLEPTLVGWNSVINPLIFHDIDYTLKPNADRFEEGSANTISIFAMGAALDLIEALGVEAIGRRIRELIDIAVAAGKKRGWEFFTPLDDPARRGAALSFKIPGVETGPLVADLYKRKFYCADRAGWLRISPHAYNNEEDIHKFLAALPDA